MPGWLMVRYYDIMPFELTKSSSHVGLSDTADIIRHNRTVCILNAPGSDSLEEDIGELHDSQLCRYDETPLSNGDQDYFIFSGWIIPNGTRTSKNGTVGDFPKGYRDAQKSWSFD